MNLPIKKGIGSSISYKIKASFFSLVSILLITGASSIIASRDVQNSSNEIVKNVRPKLNVFYLHRNAVKDLVSYAYNWLYVPLHEEDKNNLTIIHEETLPELISEIKRMDLSGFGDTIPNQTAQMIQESQELVELLGKLIQNLNEYEHSKDSTLRFAIEKQLQEEVIPFTSPIVNKAQKGIDAILKKGSLLENNIQKRFYLLQVIVWIFSILGVIFAVIISLWLSNHITNSLERVLSSIAKLSLGVIPDPSPISSKDEIGQISSGVNTLIQAMANTSAFAKQIHKGNLNADYQLLSDDDELGHSLIAMRNNLNEIILDTNAVVKEVSEQGKFDSRLSLKDKKGAWHQLSESINLLFSSISEPLKLIMDVLMSMSEGDLTNRYTKESVGDLKKLTNHLNNALDNLETLLSQITETGGIINNSTTEMLVKSSEMDITTSEIASAIGQMSSGAMSQVNKVDESSQLVENILESAKGMAVKSDAINAAAKQGAKESTKGSHMIGNVEESINEISEISIKASGAMSKLEERSSEIERVLSVITDISSQTNLLALNAAIEAAQAGDKGRGFAIVADEIRKLAEDSRKSANEIENLVSAVAKDTKSTASMMQKMKSSVDKGVTASKEAATVFNQISESAANTLNFSEDIQQASKLQSNKIMEVVAITEAIVVVAEQTSAGTEEISSSATELASGTTDYNEKAKTLKDLSEKLKEGLSQFKLHNEKP